MRRVFHCWLIPLALLPLAGCAVGVPCRFTEKVELQGDGHLWQPCAMAAPACPMAPASQISESTLPLVERGKLEHEFTQSLKPVAFEQPAGPPPEYRALSAFECQCLAAGANSLANLLDQERWAIPPCPRLNQHCHKRKTKMRDAILFYTALQARNQQAGAALEVYYRIAEGEARIELVQQTIAFLDDALAKTKDLVRQGIAGSQDYETILRQRIEFEAHLLELKLAVDTLNVELKQLLGMQPVQGEAPLCTVDGELVAGGTGNWRFRPALAGETPAAHVDLNSAVHTGLTYRPELTLLDTVVRDLDLKTLAVVAELIKSFNALLVKQPGRAQALMLICKLLKGGLQEEVEKARGKIEAQLRERERLVTKEVAVAVTEANARAELAQLARRQVESRLSTVKDLEERSQRGIVGFQTLTEGRLNWLKARGEAIAAVSKWHIALARVRLAQGILALECGFGYAEDPCAAPLVQDAAPAYMAPLTEESPLEVPAPEAVLPGQGALPSFAGPQLLPR